MKRLILTRHAKSSWDDPMTPDHDRPLNERGKAAAADLGQWLASRDYVPEEVLCSDALRTRKTFSGFVTELRLHKACKLLKENELSVTSICYDCGFNNVSNFNRQFLKQYEMNPVKYRKLFF